MPRFTAWDIRWTQEEESRPVEYKGKMVYCTAESAEKATKIFEEFAKREGIPVTDMCAEPLTEEPTDDRYFKV